VSTFVYTRSHILTTDSTRILNIKISNRANEPNGTVFLSGFQHLVIKHDPLTEYLPAVPCGNAIPDDIQKLQRLGKEVWENQSGTERLVEVLV
jgi:hypothetical protein